MVPLAAIRAGRLQVEFDRQLQMHMAPALPAVVEAIELAQRLSILAHGQVVRDQLHRGVVFQEEVPEAFKIQPQTSLP